MRGKRAKLLRELVWRGGNGKYSRNREYRISMSPNQYRHKMPLTILTDDERYLYQVLKGRRYILENSGIR